MLRISDSEYAELIMLRMLRTRSHDPLRSQNRITITCPSCSFRSQQSQSWLRHFRHFRETEDSWQCSQQPATCTSKYIKPVHNPWHSFTKTTLIIFSGLSLQFPTDVCSPALQLKDSSHPPFLLHDPPTLFSSI